MTTIPPSHESPVEAQTAAALVAHLAERGVRLCAEGTALRVDAPAGVMTEELKAQLVTHKTAVVAVLAQAAVDDSAGRRFPLSYAQERLWFLDQLQPGQPLYVMSWAYHLGGPLDVPALARALGDLVRRHAVLRTVYALQGGAPCQVVRPAQAVPLPVLDLAHLPAAARTVEAQRLAQTERDLPFDLANDPMLRAQLLHLAAGEHVLLVALHHIASDGWSMDVFWRELAALYAAHRAGDAVTLPPLPLQYADYAVWQRQMMAAGAWDGQLAYWRRQLHDLPSLALPYDGSQLALATPRGDAWPVTVPPLLTTQLRALARSEGVTLAVLLLAAFQVLLADVCGQDDVAVGMPVAGRGRVELEGLIGFCANTLVMRGDLAGHPTFRQFLHQVRQTVLSGLENQDFPFSHLVADLRPARLGARNPLFQVLFQFASVDEAGPMLADVAIERLPVAGSHAKFDLELLLRETGETLSGRLVFDAQLFGRVTIERLAAQLVGLLHDIAADPDRRVGTEGRVWAHGRQPHSEECRTPTCGTSPRLRMRTPLTDPVDSTAHTATGRSSSLDGGTEDRVWASGRQPHPEECRTPTCGTSPHLGMRTPLTDPVDSAAHTATEAVLVDLWGEILGLPEVSIHDDFFVLGGHSLGAIRLCAAVEQRLGVQLPVATLFRAPTIARLAVELAAGLSDGDWSSVVPIQVGGSRPPFFCVHGFAGGVGAYAALAQALGPDQPFYGLQAAGVDGRLPPDGTIEAMAARYVADVHRVQPVGPYYVGGYCFGGVVAFEMARQLAAQGEALARVVIIEGMAPRRFHRRLATYDVRRWQTLWRSLPFWLDEYRALGWARVQRRAQAKIGRQWKAFRQRVGNPVALAPQDLIDADLSAAPEHLSALMVTHLQALRRYAPQPSAVRVTLFRAQLQTVSKVLFGALDPEYGWGSLAQGGVDVRPVAAGHRTIHLPPHVTALADALRECLIDVT